MRLFLDTNVPTMGNIIDKKETIITTNECRSIVRRVTTVLCPNGQYRYPVDYYDGTPGGVKVSENERKRIAIPGYKQLI